MTLPTHSGPTEDDLSAAISEAIQARAERDEADRAAGAALRQLERLRDSERSTQNWLRRAKEEAGYHPNVSFDIVWAETLEKAKRFDAISNQP